MWTTSRILIAAWALGSLPALAAEAPLKIATYGTSLSASGRWQPFAQASLGKCRGSGVEFVNVARAATTVTWGLENYRTVVETGADVVLIEFAVNDAHLVRGKPLPEARRETAELIGRLRREMPRAKLYLMTTGPVFDKQAEIRPHLLDYFAMYRGLARETGVGLIDTYPEWASVPKEQIPDGVHPLTLAMKNVLVPVVARVVSAAHCRSGSAQ